MRQLLSTRAPVMARRKIGPRPGRGRNVEYPDTEFYKKRFVSPRSFGCGCAALSIVSLTDENGSQLYWGLFVAHERVWRRAGCGFVGSSSEKWHGDP